MNNPYLTDYGREVGRIVRSLAYVPVRRALFCSRRVHRYVYVVAGDRSPGGGALPGGLGVREHREEHGPGGRGLEGRHQQEDSDLVRTERPEVLDDLLELRHDDDDDYDDYFLCVLSSFFNSTSFM